MAAKINVKVKSPTEVGFMQILAPQNVKHIHTHIRIHEILARHLNGEMLLSPLTYNLAKNKKKQNRENNNKKKQHTAKTRV